MSRFFGIINALGVIFIASCLFGIVGYTKNAEYEVQQIRLNTQLKYCVDSAADYALKSASSITDYTELGIDFNPDGALDTFLTVFCLGYDMIPNDENKALIELNYVPFFIVMGNDGYYSGYQQRLADGKHKMIFSPKMPFLFRFSNQKRVGDGLVGDKYAVGTKIDSYAFNLAGEPIYRVWENNNNIRNIANYDDYPEVTDENGNKFKYTREKVLMDMSFKLVTEMKVAIEKSSHDSSGGNFHIPAQLNSTEGVNGLFENLGGHIDGKQSKLKTGATVITAVQGLTLTTREPIDAFTVGGAKLTQADYILCYTRNGQKLYCYAEDLDAGTNIEMVVNSPREAAKNGYYADLNKILK